MDLSCLATWLVALFVSLLLGIRRTDWVNKKSRASCVPSHRCEGELLMEEWFGGRFGWRGCVLPLSVEEDETSAGWVQPWIKNGAWWYRFGWLLILRN